MIDVILKVDACALTDTAHYDENGDLVHTVKKKDENRNEYEAPITAMYAFIVKPLKKLSKGFLAFALFSNCSLSEERIGDVVKNYGLVIID